MLSKVKPITELHTQGLQSSQKYQITFSKACQNMETSELLENSTLIQITQEAAEALLNLTTCTSFIRWPRLQELAVAVQLQGVAPSPGCTARATDGVVEFVALAKPTALAPC